MDTNIATILIIALFALIIVGGFLVYRKRSKIDINTPLGSLHMESSNEETLAKLGIVIEDAVSRGGGILTENTTGTSTEIRRVDVQDDIIATSTNPGANPNPKV